MTQHDLFAPKSQLQPLRGVGEIHIGKFSYTELAIEFRSADWYHDSVYEFFKVNELLSVVVDLPNLPGLPECILHTTHKIGSVRLHRKNGATWHNQKLGDRYDYNYSSSEFRNLE